MSTKASPTDTMYNEAFYRSQVHGSVRSAKLVMEALFEYLQPRSVLDLGCGRGGWLAAAGELGATKLVGRDGPWIERSALLSQRIEFESCDMAAEIPVEGRFDMAISIEVAEHLPPSRAESFVDTLCSASDIVLFGAAIPRQGGTGHVNERCQSY